MRKLLFELWLLTRPRAIRQLARQYPPYNKYVLKGESGDYTPIAYSEDGTIRCLKTDWLGFQYQVFGINPSDLILKEEQK